MITILSNPKNIDLLRNGEMIYRLTSDAIGNSDYQLKVAIRQGSTDITEAFLDAVDGVFYFNLSLFFQDLYPNPFIPATVYQWDYPKIAEIPFLRLRFTDNYGRSRTVFPHAFDGRVEKHKYANFVFDYYNLTLNTQPAIKRTCWDTPEYIYFIKPEDEAYNSFILRTFYYFKDGSITSNDFPFGLVPNDTICLPVALKYRGFSESYEIYKYTCQIFYAHENTPKSPLFTYQINQNIKNQNVFGFLNTKFGIFESVICRGQMTVKSDVKINTWDYKVDEFSQSISQMGYEYEQNTGLMTTEEIKYTQQLTQSANHLYILRENIWVRVKLVDFSDTIIDNQKGLHSFNFRFQYPDLL